MAIRTLTEIINDAIAFIQSKIPNLTLLEGTVARDVVIESPAQEFDQVYQELDRTQQIQTFDDPTVFEGTELDDRAADVGLVRLGGTTSTTSVTFRQPTLNVDVTITAGTKVTTNPTQLSPNIISFVTTSTGQLLVANAASYLNPLTGLYEITLPVEAETTGSTGNVGVGTITTLISTISGASSMTVYNSLGASGGADAESDEQLAARIRTKQAGNNVGTSGGILSLVRANSNVLDALLVRPGDPELLRNQFGNSIDIVVIGEINSEITENHVFTTSQLEVPLNVQPVRAVSAVTGVVGALPYTFIENTDYVVNLDTTSMFAGTPVALSNITFLSLGTLPDNASAINITYTYNQLIQDLYTTLISDENKIVGSDPLPKEAVKVLVQVGAIIKTFPGYTHSDVTTAAATNVSNLLNNVTLDAEIDQSDIIATIQNTPGVDAVTIPIALAVKRPSDPGFIAVSNIVIQRTEYARPDTIVIT